MTMAWRSKINPEEADGFGYTYDPYAVSSGLNLVMQSRVQARARRARVCFDVWLASFLFRSRLHVRYSMRLEIRTGHVAGR